MPASTVLNFDSFLDAALDDTDFAFLFDASVDGLMDEEGAAHLGFANLEFADWVVAFSGRPLHPSLAPTNAALPAAAEAGMEAGKGAETASQLRQAIARVVEYHVISQPQRTR